MIGQCLLRGKKGVKVKVLGKGPEAICYVRTVGTDEHRKEECISGLTNDQWIHRGTQ
jgi:hypothetical protein